MQGFLPASRAPLMMDVVACAMIVVLPVLACSIAMVRRRHFRLHKRIQVGLMTALVAVVTLFEIEVRTLGWRSFASSSPFQGGALGPVLVLHIIIASSTSVAWIVTIAHALRRIPKSPAPSSASVWHKRLGWTTVAGTVLTSCTGWVFYWMAFLA